MKKIVQFTFLSFFLATQSFAQMSSCELAKVISSELEQKKEERISLLEIHDEKMKAQRIKEGLVNDQSEREILLLAESIQSEIDQLKKDQVGHYVSGGLSVGSVIMASYFIKRMSSTAQGLSFKRKLMRQLTPTGPRAGLRTLTNSVFFIGTVASIYVFYKINQDQDEMSILSDLIDQLDSIRDFTNQIQDLDEHIEEMQVSYEILIDQVVEEQTGRWENQKLSCF